MARPPSDSTWVAIAEDALAQRHSSPEGARRLAMSVLDGAAPRSEAAAIARLANALALRELNDLANAATELARAEDLAAELALTKRLAEIQSARVNLLTMMGHPKQALELAESIVGLGSEAATGELEMRRGLALLQIGRIDDAIAAYSTALPAVRSGDDPLVEIRLLSNRANAFAYQGDHHNAQRDALVAERLANEQSQDFLAGCAAHNAAFAAGRMGAIVEALNGFERAEEAYRSVGFPGRSRGVLAADRSEVLLAAGLLAEACDEAAIAVESLEDADDVNDLAEARLLHARASAAFGDHRAAKQLSERAHDDFVRTDRPGWAALAEELFIRSTLLDDPSDRDRDRSSAERVDEIVRHLDTSGWPAEAVSIRISAAELAMRVGDTKLAAQHLAAASTARLRGRADRRAAAWLATARLRRLEGNWIGAQRAVDAGLRVFLKHQATLGATELRAGATAHAEELAALNVQLAVDGGRPRRILLATERLRANALGFTSAPSVGRTELQRERERLRLLQTELLEAERTSVHDVAESRHAVNAQEGRIRKLARRLEGSGETSADLDLDQLFAALGEGELVEFVQHRGRIGAVVVSRRRCRFHDLTDLSLITPTLDDAAFGLARAARRNASPASIDAAMSSLDQCVRTLDEILVAPLRLRGERTVVIPTGRLHGVAWSSLSTLSKRALSVSPSARNWSTRSNAAPRVDRLRVVVGPGLEHAAEEGERVARRYPSADILGGSEATVEAALEMLNGADVVHISCHGTLRSDSPMFSSLLMADGSINVFDIEELDVPPSTVVLPACNSGSADVSAGDELIGTASALLGVGVGSVIAPISVVNDSATVDVMDRLHAGLARGESAPVALQVARAAAFASGDPATRAVSAALVALE